VNLLDPEAKKSVTTRQNMAKNLLFKMHLNGEGILLDGSPMKKKINTL